MEIQKFAILVPPKYSQENNHGSKNLSEADG